MANIKQQLYFLTLLVLLVSNVLCEEQKTTPDTKEEELIQSETKDGKIEIIKRIKKVNEDGSYTIGYEADDGSFKIESRDVLGNIKGTYGFVDDEGQIKRVSYSTSNSSEIISKPEPASVVQRIPIKSNRTVIVSTKRPSIYGTTQSTPTTTSSAIQSIARRRNIYSSTSTSTTTTQRPNYEEVVHIGAKTTAKPVVVTPRVLLPIRSTLAPQIHLTKHEGQLSRPEIISNRPTELPLFRRLQAKHPLLDDDQTKPVAEEEERSNILRRQLSERPAQYELQDHVFNLQQSLGHDATDVYSASMTTGTPRPLFTTTSRSRILSSTPQPPIVISRPTIRYSTNFQRNLLQDTENTTPDYIQESSSTTAQPSLVKNVTPTPVPVVQIPANRPTPEPLVAIRHPFQRGAILVPLSQLQQGRVLPVESMRDVSQAQHQYETDQQQYVQEKQPVVVRRLPPPPLRPIPVHVDENGYIREVPHQVATPYPIPVPATPPPQRYVDENENEIDNIEPPVSTRDFQKLLQMLILRQTRLERISAIANGRRYYQPQYRPVYQPTPMPYLVQKTETAPPNGAVQYLTEEEVQQRNLALRQQQIGLRQQQEQQQQYINPQSYVPTRRVARLLPTAGRTPAQQLQGNDEYLPPDVREMLLLRMLQLAINPARPTDEEDMETATTQQPHYQKSPIRNVEILGEEQAEEREQREIEPKRASRIKRYREDDMMYSD